MSNFKNSVKKALGLIFNPKHDVRVQKKIKLEPIPED